MKTLKINGTPQTFPEGLPETLGHLLQHLKMSAATVVAEVDGAVVKREDFDHTRLADAEAVELIRFVGGG